MLRNNKNNNTLIISIFIVIILLLAMLIQIEIKPKITGRTIGKDHEPYHEPPPPPPRKGSSCILKDLTYIWVPEKCFSLGSIKTKIALFDWFPPYPGCEPPFKYVDFEICQDVLAIPEEYYGPDEIKEIQDATEVDYSSSFDSSILSSNNIDVTLSNNGDKSIRNIGISIETPPSTDAYNQFISKISKNWENENIIGLGIYSTINSRLLQWNTTPAQNYDELKPKETIKTNFTITTPITDSEQEEIYLIIKSNNQTVYNETIKNSIDVPQFLVIPDICEDNILDIYMLISNTENEDKRFNIEFNIDKHASLPKTILAEYFGPYSIKANDIKIAAYKYRYDDYLAGSDYLLKATLYEKGEKVAESTNELNLISITPTLEKPFVFKNSTLLLILILVLSVVVISIKIYKTKKEIHERRKQQYTRLLNTFFAKAIGKGHAKENIKRMLVDKLWPENIVIKYCDKVFKDIEEKIRSLKK